MKLPRHFGDTRDTLQRVAVHVVARARHEATGRFGLRVTPGGFGTPAFGGSTDRVRVSGGLLVRESAGADAATTAAVAIDGRSLADLAAVARVDLAAELDVGHDTPVLGDVHEPLRVDEGAARALGEWYRIVAEALDVVLASGQGTAPSAVQLWPEHFDVAVDVAWDPSADDTRRVNLGGSPGDGFHADPYLYVGPWTDDRPGGPGFWNAPFGAVVDRAAILAGDDPVAAAVTFFLEGLERLQG